MSTPRPVRDGIAIGVAVGLVGIAFGVLARTSGLSLAKTCAMSLLVFTGASQFAAVSISAAGGSVGAALGSALLLAARNGLYGAVVARWLADRPAIERLAATQLVIDESTGVGAAQPDSGDSPAPLARTGFLAAGLAVYVIWNLGTLAGALAGDLIGGTGRWGLDAAFPAAYLALLAPHLRDRAGRVTGAVAAGLVVATIPVLPTGVPVLVAVAGVVPGARLRAAEATA